MSEKKLTKSNDKKIFGVCAGVAEYFSIDATIIRLIWAVAILVYGAGFWVYIIMAIVMPAPSELSDKQEPSEPSEPDAEEIVVEVEDVEEDTTK